MASKCKEFLIYQILPISILLISLLELYFHYSTITTIRSKAADEKSELNSIYSYIFKGRRFDLDLKKIEEDFYLRPFANVNSTLKIFQKIDEKRGVHLDKRIHMLFYFLLKDFIYIIFIYIFIYGGYKSGIIKIIFQLLKFYYISKRIKKLNPNLFPHQVVLNFFNNASIRDWTIFSQEGYQNFEYLCNLVIILDFIWLYILIKQKCHKKKRKIYTKSYIEDKAEDKNEISLQKGSYGMKENNISENNINNNISDYNINNNIKEGNKNVIEDNEEEESMPISEEDIKE